MSCFDIIGDIHGQFQKLSALLRLLGYQEQNSTWRHPEGRRVVFLGDYIDRGPAIPAVLMAVRGMVEAGDAIAILGNHEFNAICYAEPDGNGGWLRSHDEMHRREHAATLDQFAGHPEQWAEWLKWFKTLPFALDLGGIRAVHACWDSRRLKVLEGKSLSDPAFLRACVTRQTPERRAVDNVLKGPELPLPEGASFIDKEGVARRTVRARWWHLREGMCLGELTMPPGSSTDARVPEAWQARRLPDYGPDEPPAFFGHYWLAPDAPLVPLAPNIACLDFSAGKQGPLVAYRWNGGNALGPADFVAADAPSMQG